VSPFTLADPARTRSILEGAGLTEVRLDHVRAPVLLGGSSTVDGALEYLRRSRQGRVIAEAAPDESSAERIYGAIADAFAPFVTERGVEMTAAVWVVSARRP
jgi:hypothetical protein